jgi:hypothetical protein
VDGAQKLPSNPVPCIRTIFLQHLQKDQSGLQQGAFLAFLQPIVMNHNIAKAILFLIHDPGDQMLQ